jgi:hypothetical protein
VIGFWIRISLWTRGFKGPTDWQRALRVATNLHSPSVHSLTSDYAWKRVLDSWTRHPHGRQTHVIHDGVRIRRRQIENINADGGGIIHGHLHGSISGNDVASNEIALHPGDQADPVGIARDDVVDDDVVVRPWSNQTDAEVVSRRCITISTQPVRTEPVTACAAGQSYAATRTGSVPVPNGNVPLQLVLGRRSQENAGEAIRRCGD